MYSSSSPETGKRSEGCLALVGFMAAGKSAVGMVLAQELGLEFVDLDEVISRESGMNIEDIFATEGEEGFRKRESEALVAQLAGGARVLSCGGGLVLRRENVALLRERCRVYLLDISRRTAVERLKGKDGRPLLAGEEDLELAVDRLMGEREEIYRRAAHEIVDANAENPREIAEEIAERWRKYAYGPQTGNTRSS